jgi:segregation and condensation protein B
LSTSSEQTSHPSALDDDALRSVLESLLLVAGGPVGIAALAAAAGVPAGCVSAALDQLRAALRGGIRLQLLDNSAQLVTAPENVEFVHRFLGTAKPPGLSRAGLETLSVIAYRQPVTRSEIEEVRGVNSDRALQTLLARGLIEERGRREALGHPMQYGTSFGFLEYFGLSSLDELPLLPPVDREHHDAAELGLRNIGPPTAAGRD